MSHRERGELETLQEVREAGAGAGGGSSKRFTVVVALLKKSCNFLVRCAGYEASEAKRGGEGEAGGS